MKKLARDIAVLVALILGALAYHGCGSPAGPPAPPTEIPSPVVLKFVEPDDLRIDLSTVRLADASISKAVDPGGEFSDAISFGAVISEQLFGGYLEPLLGGMSKLEIPVSESMTAYHELFDFGFPIASGDVLLREVRDVKISFADYDIDNDGTTEGCSGHTAGLPICVRMWLDDERYLAWIFQSYPYFDDPATPEDDANAGRGSFILFINDSTLLFIGADLYELLDYDFEDPDNKGLDAYFYIDSVETSSGGADIKDRFRITQVGPDATAVKQIARSVQISDAGAVLNTGYYLAQFREGYDFWSGSYATGSPDDLANQCAVISTGNGTDEANCADVGGIDIRVGGIPYLDPLDPADVAAPNDFPETPPAGMF